MGDDDLDLLHLRHYRGRTTDVATGLPRAARFSAGADGDGEGMDGRDDRRDVVVATLKPPTKKPG